MKTANDVASAKISSSAIDARFTVDTVSSASTASAGYSTPPRNSPMSSNSLSTPEMENLLNDGFFGESKSKSPGGKNHFFWTPNGSRDHSR
jgi:hypothetical protein